MLHFVKKEEGETLAWRDTEDILAEMTRVRHRIGAAQECYAALETARRSLVSYPEEEETMQLLTLLLDEAKVKLDHIEEACMALNQLQKEMRDTGCLLQRM